MAPGAGMYLWQVTYCLFIGRHFTADIKIEKILSDKKQYVAVHQSMTAPLFQLQRNRVGGQ